MTDQLYVCLTQAMERLCGHPISQVFQNFREIPDSDPLVGLDQIRGFVQKRLYRTLEEWLYDVRRLRDSCSVCAAARAAGEVERLARREYERLLLFTGSEAWFERYVCMFRNLEEALSQMPLSLQISVPLFQSLSLITARSKVDRPFVCSPFEPEWHSCSDTDTLSATDDDSDFKNYWRLAQVESATPPTADETQPSDESPVFTSPEASSQPAGKTPRNLTVGSKSQPKKQKRLRLSVGGKPPVRQPRDAEIHDFLAALHVFEDREDVNLLVKVFTEHEPEMQLDVPILDIDLAAIRAETAAALIRLAKDVCQRKGVSYPVGNSPHCLLTH
jgi:hypothetical protein